MKCGKKILENYISRCDIFGLTVVRKLMQFITTKYKKKFLYTFRAFMHFIFTHFKFV